MPVSFFRRDAVYDLLQAASDGLRALFIDPSLTISTQVSGIVSEFNGPDEVKSMTVAAVLACIFETDIVGSAHNIYIYMPGIIVAP
jgi:hypothetical protein